MYSYQSSGISRYMFLISAPPNLAPGNFHRDHVGCTCSEFVWIINEIAANGDAHLIWVILLGAMVDYDSCVSDGTIFLG